MWDKAYFQKNIKIIGQKCYCIIINVKSIAQKMDIPVKNDAKILKYKYM